MPLIRQRHDEGVARPAVNAPGNFAMRLTIGSLFALFLAFAWAGVGFKQESARAPAQSQFPDLYEASITELQDGLQKGLFTSVDLVKVSPSPTPWPLIDRAISGGRPILQESRK